MGTGGITAIWTSRYQNGGRKEVREMSFFKDKPDKKELKAKTDRVLQHVKDKITKEEYMPDELPELVNAYTDLLYARMDLERM